MRHEDIPARPTNPAAAGSAVEWPDANRSCLMLGFDFDAESAWFDDDAADTRKLVRMSHGGYGARVGVTKILELLERLGLPATFFVPGWVVETYPAQCEAILAGGHEIGHHGHFHLRPGVAAGSDPGSLEQSIAEIDRGFDAMQRHLGITPTGYRSPGGENYDELLSYLYHRGIVYSSSWRDDIVPYRHVLADGGPGPLELPANSTFDDWYHGVIRGSDRNMLTVGQVTSLWIDELTQTHEWGGLTATVLHPQVSGRPSRFAILEQFLHYAEGLDDLWIATGQMVADHIISTVPAAK